MCKRPFYLVILIVIFTDCSSNHADSKYFISKFYQNQTELYNLLSDLRSNSLLQRQNLLKIFKPTDFDNNLKSRLTNLGITEFSYSTISCDNHYKLEFDLTTNWSKKFPVHLRQSMCAHEFNKKGHYSKADNTNESWGLGDNWSLWFERVPLKGSSEYYENPVDTINHAEGSFQ